MKKIVQYFRVKPLRLGAALAILTAGSILAYGSVASAQPTTRIASIAPDRCVADRQDGNGATTSPQTTIRLTSNVQYELPNHSASWEKLKCTSISFKVPRGQTANVDLQLSGNFDAVQIDPSGNIVTNNPGWVESRFILVPDTSPGGGDGSVLEIVPNTDGRETPQTLDTTIGGINNWVASTVRASTRATCAPSTLPDFCTFKVRVEALMREWATNFSYRNTQLSIIATNSGFYGTPLRYPVTP